MIQVEKEGGDREGSVRDLMMELADLLEGEGIEVESCYESPWTDGQWHTLEFLGDDSTGKRAVQLARQQGNYPVVLMGYWNLEGNDAGSTEWTMLFREERV